MSGETNFDFEIGSIWGKSFINEKFKIIYNGKIQMRFSSIGAPEIIERCVVLLSSKDEIICVPTREFLTQYREFEIKYELHLFTPGATEIARFLLNSRTIKQVIPELRRISRQTLGEDGVYNIYSQDDIKKIDHIVYKVNEFGKSAVGTLLEMY